MALVLLPLLAMMFLLMDTAWMIFARASIQEAVREGVRFGITGQDEASIVQVVQQYSSGFVNAQNSGVVHVQYTLPGGSTTPLNGCGAKSAGNILQVSVTGLSISPMAPLWRDSKALSLNASAADAMEPGGNCP